MAVMATAQAALSTLLIFLNVGESQYSRGVVWRAYSAVNGSTGTVSRRYRPNTTPTSGLPHSNSHRSTPGPPTKPVTAMTAKRTSEPRPRIWGPCRRRSRRTATAAIAVARSALHATPSAASRCETTEKTIHGRKPVTRASGVSPGGVDRPGRAGAGAGVAVMRGAPDQREGGPGRRDAASRRPCSSRRPRVGQGTWAGAEGTQEGGPVPGPALSRRRVGRTAAPLQGPAASLREVGGRGVLPQSGWLSR